MEPTHNQHFYIKHHNSTAEMHRFLAALRYAFNPDIYDRETFGRDKARKGIAR